jgi:hypothetical protein
MAKKDPLTATEQKIILEVLMLFASIPIFRGLWHLMDIYFLPSNPAASAFWSLVIGVAALVVILYYFNQPHIKSRWKNM